MGQDSVHGAGERMSLRVLYNNVSRGQYPPSVFPWNSHVSASRRNGVGKHSRLRRNGRKPKDKKTKLRIGILSDNRC
jgi:hypothetical protein